MLRDTGCGECRCPLAPAPHRIAWLQVCQSMVANSPAKLYLWTGNNPRQVLGLGRLLFLGCCFEEGFENLSGMLINLSTQVCWLLLGECLQSSCGVKEDATNSPGHGVSTNSRGYIAKMPRAHDGLVVGGWDLASNATIIEPFPNSETGPKTSFARAKALNQGGHIGS